MKEWRENMKISSVLNKQIFITPKIPKENERLCEYCQGTGLLYIEENNGEKYLEKCKKCFNGVISLCEYCKNTKEGMCLDKQCRMKREQQEELNRFNKANKYTLKTCPKEFMEMFFSELKGSEEGYDSTLDWIDNYELENKTKVKYVWGTRKIPFKLDCGFMIESALEYFEDVDDGLNRIIDEERDKLEKACNEFEKAHKEKLVSYCVDYNVCILLDE